eukprot:1159742-Pelagomonas_calceolata.AAC.4
MNELEQVSTNLLKGILPTSADNEDEMWRQSTTWNLLPTTAGISHTQQRAEHEACSKQVSTLAGALTCFNAATSSMDSEPSTCTASLVEPCMCQNQYLLMLPMAEGRHMQLACVCMCVRAHVRVRARAHLCRHIAKSLGATAVLHSKEALEVQEAPKAVEGRLIKEEWAARELGFYQGHLELAGYHKHTE